MFQDYLLILRTKRFFLYLTITFARPFSNEILAYAQYWLKVHSIDCVTLPFDFRALKNERLSEMADLVQLIVSRFMSAKQRRDSASAKSHVQTSRSYHHLNRTFLLHHLHKTR